MLSADMFKRAKKLYIDKRRTYIGEGMYAKVYKISAKRVVKVYRHDDEEEIINEIKGSRLSKYALPVLRVVRVHAKGEGFIGFGLVKRYIPHEVTDAEASRLCDYFCRGAKMHPLANDCHVDNVRKDNKGRIYLIDTQMDPS